MRKQQKKKKQEFTEINEVKLVRGGKEYFELLHQMIAQAKESIHLQTYIFDNDETGTAVGEALKEAAKRKVQVYLMVDGYASQSLSKKFINDLQAEGVHFRFFSPLLKSRCFYFGRRLHQKLLVVDTRFAMVGGVNISDKYNDKPGSPAWLDFAISLEGEAAQDLCVLCWKAWRGFPAKMGLTPCEKIPIQFNIPVEKRSRVRIRRNDWVKGKTQISRSYIQMLNTAKSQVTVLCSYFLPGRIMRKHFMRAVKRGVKVRLVLAGLSDVKVAKYGERYIYDWLFRNKIEVYEYQKTVLHGKMSICDSEWLTIGSYNINNISAYASIELNLDIFNSGFAKQVEDILEGLMTTHCVKVEEKDFLKSRNIFVRFLYWSSYEFIKFMFFLFTFYFRQRG